MFKVTSNVRITKNLMPNIQQSLRSLTNTDVLVGIPEGDIGDHSDITNAELMYILTHGVRSTSMREEMDAMMQFTGDGIPYTASYNKMLQNMDGGMPYSAAYDLYMHEHGSALWHTPPRPILEPAIQKHKEEIAKELQKAAVSALNGQDALPELHKAGQVAENAAKLWFTDPENHWPENSPYTIAKKGSDKPNLDTSNLKNSIVHVIRKR